MNEDLIDDLIAYPSMNDDLINELIVGLEKQLKEWKPTPVRRVSLEVANVDSKYDEDMMKDLEDVVKHYRNLTENKPTNTNIRPIKV